MADLDIGLLYVTLLNPCAIAATVAMWLAILGWALTSVLHEHSFFASVALRVPRWLVPVVSLGGGLATLVDRWLLFIVGANISLLPFALTMPDRETTDALMQWYHAGPRVWLALAMLGPVVVLICYVLSLLLPSLGMHPEQHRRVVVWVVGALLVVGTVIALVGFGWPIATAYVDPDTLIRSLKVDRALNPQVVAFSPLALLLTISLSVVVAGSKDKQYIGVAGRMAMVVVIVVGIAIAWLIAGRLPAL